MFAQASELSTGGLAVEERGKNSVVGPQAPPAAEVVHGRPPVIHRLSTGFLPKAVDTRVRLTTACPQNLQQDVHTRPPAGG